VADRIERTWDGKTFVFVDCHDYDETDLDRVLAGNEYTVVQLSCSTSDFWQEAPGPLVFRSSYLFVWVTQSEQLADFADAVIALFAVSEDFTKFDFSNGRVNTQIA